MYAYLYFPVEELDISWLIVLLIEELEVDVSIVDDDEIDVIFIIFFEMFEYLFLIFILEG